MIQQNNSLAKIDKLAELKKILNYTHSSIEVNVIKIHRMCFVYFNDYEECIEIHSPRMFEFVKNGRLNRETILFCIDYRNVIEEELIIKFNKDGKIEKISFGSFRPMFTFLGFHKQTSPEGEYNGPFTVEDGFQLYHHSLLQMARNED